jgi:hypothetical protein
MIRSAVRRGLETSVRQRYDSALAGVWGDLSRTLARLEALAAEPDDLDEGALAVLPGLQYALHRAGELTAGIDPPPGEEDSHAELAAALSDARDTTGDVADALEAGGQPSAALLVHEWRGALFRVRLARHRLQTTPASPESISADPAPSRAALFSTALVVGGVTAFTAGAMLTLWPLWALGLVLVAGGFFVYRP